MEKKFPNHSDAHMRIDGGIGLYDGVPCRITMEGSVAWLYDLRKKSSIPDWQVDMNDEKLVTHSLPLGYCDVQWTRRVYENDQRRTVTTPTVAFFSRASHRKQKSVVHPSNVSITLPEQIGAYLDGAHQQMYTPAFGKMLLGEFSTNRDFTKFKLYEGQAMSRNFAILQLEGEQILLFNEARIGSRKDYTQGFGISPDYNNSLMIDRLSQAGIPAG